MKDVDMHIFAKRLKQKRKEEGLTTLELGKQVNISDAQISRYETENRVPSLANAIKIANYFGVTIDWLAGQEDVNIELEHLTSIYNKLSEVGKKQVINFAEYLIDKGEV